LNILQNQVFVNLLIFMLTIESKPVELPEWQLSASIRTATVPCACGFGVEVPRGHEKFVRRGGRGIFWGTL
jgi:hypothetical protein